ncbi:Wzz/FepE/Etk N-terminal domain-containing protein [Synechococcus sp. AH-601-J22]|nr:Wzz/FepE/Etk N-terminal domain-containing protein [Synechococcus sp. AH-601-J22]
MTIGTKQLNLTPLPSEDEIDLRQIVAALNRQKKLIAGVAGTAVLLSGIYAFTRNPIWQGESQIVLENENSGGGSRLGQLATANKIFGNLPGIGDGGGSKLQTEVAVLESPSVLMPTFDFVKDNKAKQGADTSKWSFTSWRDGNLKIELKKGTSVLNIIYRDTDPDLVLPVIKRITSDYQRYSGRDRKRGLTRGIIYLEKQVLTLRKQADLSMRKAQAYALLNELGLQDGMPAASGKNSAGTSFEAKRGQAQQRVNALQQQLISARRAGNRSVFQAPQIAANIALYSQLQTLESNLQHKQSLLKPNDDAIRRLQRKRENLIKYINQQTIGLLEGELITAQSQLSSLNRPDDVVLKHRELVRTALRDENTLAELENQLQTLQLEQARQTEPWELISTPTLLETPIAPRKKRIVTLGLLAGLVIGSGAALIIDRQTGLIFSEDELKSVLPAPLLERLSLHSNHEWESALQLIAEGPLKNAKSIGLVPVGQPDSSAIQQFQKQLQKVSGNNNIELNQDLIKTKDCDTQLLLIQPGFVARKQLSQLNQSLALQGTPIAGWVLLDPDLALG